MPMVCSAPGRFSTSVRQPSASASSAATTRLMMSGGVPATVGTTMRIVFDGKGCACPVEAAPSPAATSIKNATCGNPRSVTMDVLLGGNHSQIYRRRLLLFDIAQKFYFVLAI